MSKKTNIIFIAPQLQQPRVIRRISTIYTAGFPIKVYGFDSGIFSNNLKSINFPVTEIIKRDKKDSRIKKILCFIKTLNRIRRENSKDDIYYIFSAEMGIFSWILRHRKTIYEEADILGANFPHQWLRSLFRYIDKKTIGRSLLTVFTSDGFVNYTFGECKIPENIIVVPNKLNKNFFNSDRKSEVISEPIDINHIKFGFVGIIRYPNTIVRFAEVIGREFPQHEFHFFGDPDVPSYLNNVRKMTNVYLHGPFVNPVELPSIYSQIDIVISCYDISSWNVRIAEPNKLYEAIFFETPIVVSKDTFLSKKVQSLKVGYSIKADDDQSIINFLNNINIEDLNAIRYAERQVPWMDLVDDTTHFLKCIKKIIEK